VTSSAGVDLSAESAPKRSTVDELLDEARARRNLRFGAAVGAAALIAWLGYLEWVIVCAVRDNLAFITVPAVSMLAAVVVAQAALAIAVLRSIFTDHGPSAREEKATDPAVTTGAVEVARSLVAAAQDVLKGIKGGG
jgi:hypothetical protein